jgi:hypothetical protein
MDGLRVHDVVRIYILRDKESRRIQIFNQFLQSVFNQSSISLSSMSLSSMSLFFVRVHYLHEQRVQIDPLPPIRTGF